MDANWVKVCKTDDILPYSGVAALVFGRQVAIFRLMDEYYAISNYDPFSGAYVLSRGIVGDRGGIAKVASPIYKQSFSLVTGECLDESSIRLPIYSVQVLDGFIYIGLDVDKNSRYFYQEVITQNQDQLT